MTKKPMRLLAVLLAMLLIAGCHQTDNTSEQSTATSSTTSTTSTVETEETTSPSETSETTVTDPDTTTTEGTGPTSPAVTTKNPTTPSEPKASKVVGANIGAGYYIVSPIDDHPGVVGMDAHYVMQARDKMGNYLPASDMEISVNNSSVKVSGAMLVVPYSVRSSSSPITVTVKQKSKPNRTGSYTFQFQKFSADPTLHDDFDTLNTDLWKTGWYQGMAGGVIEDGNLVFRAESDAHSFVMSTTGTFNQAYGCFSARISMPQRGLVNGAFWLCTEPGVVYIKNPQRPVQSGGELDIVEYYPAWGDGWAGTIHWNGWSDYHRSSGKDTLQGENIAGNYHIYSAVWTPDAIYWYFDGLLCWVYTGEGVGPNSGPMQVLLQMSVKKQDDAWGGKYDPDAFPVEMKTDWVTVHTLT